MRSSSRGTSPGSRTVASTASMGNAQSLPVTFQYSSSCASK
jgi:hypothetical protein